MWRNLVNQGYLKSQRGKEIWYEIDGTLSSYIAVDLAMLDLDVFALVS